MFTDASQMIGKFFGDHLVTTLSVLIADREESSLAGNRAMSPPCIARRGIQREIGGERRRSGRMVFEFEETGWMKVVVLL